MSGRNDWNEKALSSCRSRSLERLPDRERFCARIPQLSIGAEGALLLPGARYGFGVAARIVLAKFRDHRPQTATAQFCRSQANGKRNRNATSTGNLITICLKHKPSV